ncbi:MAG: hypothetical protein KGQ52_10670 [Alphaproteobacteria bacterium]|nr:hypothetical protein [Alphaproteobacteria bacterium]
MVPASKRQRPQRVRRLTARQATTLLASAILLAAPVAGQRPDAPKSLLPPGFETPPPPPAAAPAPLPGLAPPPAEAAAGEPPLLPAEAPPPAAAVADPFAVRVVLPPGAPIGTLGPASGGLAITAFAGSNGRFVAALAGRIGRPLVSRWASIMVARALLSRAPTPAGVNDGDWVAARAGLLLRLGIVDGARRLIDALPVDRFTPATYQAAAQISLAAGDIAGLCPIAATGRALSPSPLWDLAWGMCAAMDGDDITAANLIDALRSQRSRVASFDVRLAQRVVVLAGGAGRADGINWEEVPGLTLYRYGVATAAGVPVPADRLAALGPAHAGWAVRNAGLPEATRLALLRPAAAMGALSTAELASGIAALSPADASGGFPAGSRAANLRDAFTAGSLAARGAALARLRGDGRDHGALLETAGPAAALQPDAALADQADWIIAALLAAGDARRAAAWWPVAATADAAIKARAWALLAVAGAQPASAAGFRDFVQQSDAPAHGQAMLAAALAGLNPTADWRRATADRVQPLANRWTVALAAAARRGAAGEVMLLAATGLQAAGTGGWADVPPAHVQAILAALIACNRPQEARRLAAEAVMRTMLP